MGTERRYLKTGIIFGGIALLMLGYSNEILAQEQWEKVKEGEIKDVEFEIVKDRQIFLPKASRNFSKVPPRPYEPIKPDISYEFKNFKFTTPDYKANVRPLKLQQEGLSRMFGNYVSIGFGNYASIFGEGAITTKRDKNKFLGAHLYTRSFGSGPVDGKNSASTTTELQLFGKSMGRDITVSGSANYDNRGTYFYGYLPIPETNRDKIRQTYSMVSMNAGVENTRRGDFNYSFKAGYSYLQDHYKATEGEVSLLFNSEYKIDEASKFLLNADYFLINRSDSLISTPSRQLLRIRPSYQFIPIEKLLITAGLNIAIQNDQYKGSKDLHLYPHIKAQYLLGSAVEIYGLVTGDMDKVNLHTLSAENIWINSNISISHTNRALEFQGGMKGKIGSKAAFGVGISVAALKNYYYYLNIENSALSNKFNIVYDGDTKRVNPFAEISYSQAETFRLTLRGDYFSYNTNDLQEAFHRPTYKVNFNTRYNFYDKIFIEAGIISQGGMKAVDQGLSVITLDPAFDVNLKMRYFISKEFSAFIQFNNMLSNNYPLYQSYPVRGFQALGGVNWSF